MICCKLNSEHLNISRHCGYEYVGTYQIFIANELLQTEQIYGLFSSVYSNIMLQIAFESKVFVWYTHKTSGFKTPGFKTSGFKTSGFKTSGFQNVRFTKRQVLKRLVSKRPVFKFDIHICAANF
jgi:hypothetical protein